MNVVSRRLELLKLEGLGFSQAEVVSPEINGVRVGRRTFHKYCYSLELTA